MKCAFLFNADSFEYDYGTQIAEVVLRMLLNNEKLKVSTKIFIGDLLLYAYAHDSSPIANGYKQTFNSDKFSTLITSMLCPEKFIWKTITKKGIQTINNHNIYVACLECVDFSTAEYLDYELKNNNFYVGALEIYDASSAHWLLFTDSLIPKFRMLDKTIKLFHDELNDGEPDFSVLEWLKNIGFKSAEFEQLNGRYTIFDKYHDFEHAKRIAEWKSKGSEMLAFIAEEINSKLSDAAPGIGDRLWSLIRTFESAEVNEQYAQVCATCRRILEYIADTLFPVSNEKINGHDVGKNKYKNRLLAFADETRKSNTNIDVICISTEMLNEQIDKIIKLQNKGIHDEVYRHEARRCIIRTLMLLDDIISLKLDPFEINSELDFTDIFS